MKFTDLYLQIVFKGHPREEQCGIIFELLFAADVSGFSLNISCKKK
jgi:hypothetical protein